MKFLTKLKLLGEKVAMSDTGIAAADTASKARRKLGVGFTSTSKGIGDTVGFGAWLLVRACRPCINKLEELKSAYEADLQLTTPEKDPEKESSL